ncbi:MAG: LysR family transcriptional regulator [Nitratireductor sp.]|nr:LysR family transcriptional regulator [Nitratireductor sp.]MCB1456083.1 LysR family transcriptional regulator [Nitratireductor sp.]
MNWDDYRHFLAVARTGRLSLASKQLGVDHATVGRRIRALEIALNANLFDKSPQGYALTDAGQRLVDVAESMETAAIGAAADIGGKDAVISGIVRIGAPEGVAATVLAGIVTELCRAHPQLEIQIVTLPRAFSLSKREADIAIAVSAPTSGRLKFRKIADYTLHLYGTRNYLARHPGINTVEDLRKVRGIGYVAEFIYDKELDYIPLVSPDIKPHLTSTSVHVQLEATLADGGLCILHDFMAAQYPQLQRVLPQKIAFTRSFWFIVHEDYARLERIRIVSDAIVEGMRARLA